MALTMSRTLEHRRDLLRELVVRDMKIRYKRSYLGVAWTLVNPIIQLLVFDFVFRVLFQVQTPNYTAYLFVGIVSWNWFNHSVIEATGAILNNKAMISQPGFPSALLPNVTVGTNLVHFLLTFPILLALVLYYGISPSFALLWLPVAIVVQYAFTLSLALLAACLHVSFRDTQYLLGVFLMLGFFMTPILYEVTIVPEQYRWVYDINPMTHVIDMYRAILIHRTNPAPLPVLVISLMSVVQMVLFYGLFRRASSSFAEQL